MEHKRPGVLNFGLLIGLSSLNFFLLHFVAHHRGLVLLPALLLFSYSNHSIYALLHEAIHGSFHGNRWVNDCCGRWCAAFFPTSYRLQRSFHLTHHRNNRSETEQWDYLRPGDNKFIKYAQWYSILTGLYWAFVPVASLLYLFFPGLLRLATLRDSGLARQTASGEYLSSADKLDETGARLDVLFALVFQLAMFKLLGLDFKSWLLCYGAFAFNWSSLQYADHAFSPLDHTDGAWNLRTHPLVRAALLNYPLHRAHHQHPNASWVELPDLVKDDEEPQPGYFENWLEMWKGPKRLP